MQHCEYSIQVGTNLIYPVSDSIKGTDYPTCPCLFWSALTSSITVYNPLHVQWHLLQAFFMSSKISKPTKFKWGVPVTIPIPPFGDGGVPSWSDLKFNPFGIYNIRCHIGALANEPGIFTHYKHWFEAADIAWFAAGTSEDGNYHVSTDTFHHAFNVVWSELPSGDEGGKWHKLLWTWFMKLLFNVVQHIFIVFFQCSHLLRQPYGIMLLEVQPW